MVKLRYYSKEDTLHAKTSGSAGFDLHARFSSVAEWIYPHLRPTVIGTGIFAAIPEGYYGIVTLRSSLGAKGFIIPNSPGIIDSDYRGEIKLVLQNTTSSPMVIQNGDRVAQLILVKLRDEVELERCVSYNSIVSESQDSDRGSGGFGSTGK